MKKKSEIREFEPGRVVEIVGGKYAGHAGRVRGHAAPDGRYPVMIGARVRKIRHDDLRG